jgi:hypothetical protein
MKLLCRAPVLSPQALPHDLGIAGSQLLKRHANDVGNARGVALPRGAVYLGGDPLVQAQLADTSSACDDPDAPVAVV